MCAEHKAKWDEARRSLAAMTREELDAYCLEMRRQHLARQGLTIEEDDRRRADEEEKDRKQAVANVDAWRQEREDRKARDAAVRAEALAYLKTTIAYQRGEIKPPLTEEERVEKAADDLLFRRFLGKLCRYVVCILLVLGVLLGWRCGCS